MCVRELTVVIDTWDFTYLKSECGVTTLVYSVQVLVKISFNKLSNLSY
jgi:hypothetical protein